MGSAELEENVGRPSDFAGESDEVLYARYVRGDKAAFDGLVVRHQKFAYHLAYFIAKNRTFAEEAVQDAFSLLAGSERGFQDRGPGSFKSWFGSVAVNCARNMIRNERAKMKRLQSQKYQDRLRNLNRSSNEEADDDQPLEEDSRRVIRRELEALREELRLPLMLHFYEGLSQSDVSRTIGVSPTLVKRRMTKGLELLRIRLSAQNITLTSAALIQALSVECPIVAPATLSSVLARLTTDPTAMAHRAARAANLTAQSVKASSGVSFFLWIACAVAATAALAAFVWRPPAPADEDRSEEPAPFSLSFDFDVPSPWPGIFFLGKYDWIPDGGMNGSGGLTFEPGDLLAPANINNFKGIVFKQSLPMEAIISCDVLHLPGEGRKEIQPAWLYDGKVSNPQRQNRTFLAHDAILNVMSSGVWHRQEIYIDFRRFLVVSMMDGEPWFFRAGDVAALDLNPNAVVHLLLGADGVTIDNLQIRAVSAAERQKWLEIMEREMFLWATNFECKLGLPSIFGSLSGHAKQVFGVGKSDSGGLTCDADADKPQIFALSGAIGDQMGENAILLRFDLRLREENATAARSLNLFVVFPADIDSRKTSEAKRSAFCKAAEKQSAVILPAPFAKNLPHYDSPLKTGVWHDVRLVLFRDGAAYCFIDEELHAAWSDPRRPEEAKNMALIIKASCVLDNFRARLTEPRRDAKILEKINSYR